MSPSIVNYNRKWSATDTAGAADDPRPLLYKTVRTPSFKDCLGNKSSKCLPGLDAIALHRIMYIEGVFFFSGSLLLSQGGGGGGSRGSLHGGVVTCEVPL